MAAIINRQVYSMRQTGFTLLEVLVAMAISVIVYMGSYTLLDSVITTDERVEAKREALQNIQKARYFMQQDIEQIVNRSIRSESGEQLNAVKYDGMNQSLEFTRAGWKNPIKRPRSEMQRVRYFIEDKKLYREYWNVLDRASESKNKKSVLLENADKLSFRFYGMKEKGWQSDWRKNLSDKEGLPGAIEVNLETKAYGELKWIFVLVNNKDVEDADTGESF